MKTETSHRALLYRKSGSTKGLVPGNIEKYSELIEMVMPSTHSGPERIPLIILIPSIARELVHLPHGYGYGSVFTIFAYGNDQFVWEYIPLSSYETVPRELRLKRQDEIRFPDDGKWP